MPNPLSRVKPNCNFSHGSESLSKRPAEALLIMETIASISLAENARGLILSAMLGTESHIGLSMYLSIQTASTQKALLQAAALSCLTDELLELLRRIDKSAKSIFDLRNDFAHGLWGDSEELPDAILWLSARHFLDHVVEIDDGRKHVLPMLHDRKKILVYTLTELGKISLRAKSVASLYRLFSMLLDVGKKEANEHTNAFLGYDFNKKMIESINSEIEAAFQSLT